MAEDTDDAAFARRNAVAALRVLIPELPGELGLDLAEALYDIYENPRLSEQDRDEIASLSPLNRVQWDPGARMLAPLSLLAAAEALVVASRSEIGDATDSALGMRIRSAGERLVRDNDIDAARVGALVLVVVAKCGLAFATSPGMLAASPDDRIRAAAVNLWLLRDSLVETVESLATDPSPGVRSAVARLADRINDVNASVGPVLARLAEDRHFSVRHSYANRLRVQSMD
jgi:hypothetical protein